MGKNNKLINKKKRGGLRSRLSTWKNEVSVGLDYWAPGDLSGNSF